MAKGHNIGYENTRIIQLGRECAGVLDMSTQSACTIRNDEEEIPDISASLIPLNTECSKYQC